MIGKLVTHKYPLVQKMRSRNKDEPNRQVSFISYFKCIFRICIWNKVCISYLLEIKYFDYVQMVQKGIGKCLVGTHANMKWVLKWVFEHWSVKHFEMKCLYGKWYVYSRNGMFVLDMKYLYGKWNVWLLRSDYDIVRDVLLK